MPCERRSRKNLRHLVLGDVGGGEGLSVDVVGRAALNGAVRRLDRAVTQDSNCGSLIAKMELRAHLDESYPTRP